MTNTENPLLAKIKLPGQRFRLPSRGLFYTDGELHEEVVDGEVEVFSMTTIDEIALRSPEFLFTGEAIERVFNRCIPDIIKPLRLLSKDVDFMLACLRIVSYGGAYQITTHCPQCEIVQVELNNTKREEFLSEVQEKATIQEVPFELALEDAKVKARLKTIEAKQTDEQTYTVDLKGIVNNNTVEILDEEFKSGYVITLSNGQELKLMPIRQDSAVAVYQFQNNNNDLDLTAVEEFVAFMLASTILSVDGITNWEMICEWAKELPLDLKHEMEETINKLNVWGTDFTYNIVCQNNECSHERNISTLLNPITFFMKPSKSEAPNS